MMQFMATIQKVSTLSDGSNKVVIETQELSPEDMASLFSLKGQMWCAFAATVIKKEDLQIPEYITGKEEKSPSEKLRSRMAAFFKEKNGTFNGFPNWYANALDEIGQKYLSKIQ